MPIGTHLFLLAIQIAVWVGQAQICIPRNTCSAIWLEEGHLITAVAQTAVIFYFWAGFATLHAVLDRSLAAFHPARHLVFVLVAMTTIALCIATMLASVLSEPRSSYPSGSTSTSSDAIY